MTAAPGGATATTGSGGAYTIAGLPAGIYQLGASAGTGYLPVTLSGEAVRGGQTTTCNIALPTRYYSIREAKGLSDGSRVSLASRLVSAVYASAFWIEEDDRSGGIRVSGASTLHPGDVVDVSGTLATVNGERVLESAVVTPKQ